MEDSCQIEITTLFICCFHPIYLLGFEFQLQDTRVVGPFLPSPAQPLPNELDQFMQETGDEGVILVSFGTVLGKIEDASLKMMAEAFSKLPQKIIWKLKLEGMSNEKIILFRKKIY